MKIKFLLPFVAITLISASCSQKNKITTVAEGYLKALVDYRFDDAKQLGDASTIDFILQQQEIIDSWTPAEREQARLQLKNTEVKIISVEVKETRATVHYEFIKNGQVLQAERLYLLKKDSGWLVHESM